MKLGYPSVKLESVQQANVGSIFHSSRTVQSVGERTVHCIDGCALAQSVLDANLGTLDVGVFLRAIAQSVAAKPMRSGLIVERLKNNTANCKFERCAS
jgi:hypothetical protein